MFYTNKPSESLGSLVMRTGGLDEDYFLDVYKHNTLSITDGTIKLENGRNWTFGLSKNKLSDSELVLSSNERISVLRKGLELEFLDNLVPWNVDGSFFFFRGYAPKFSKFLETQLWYILEYYLDVFHARNFILGELGFSKEFIEDNTNRLSVEEEFDTIFNLELEYAKCNKPSFKPKRRKSPCGMTL